MGKVSQTWVCIFTLLFNLEILQRKVIRFQLCFGYPLRHFLNILFWCLMFWLKILCDFSYSRYSHIFILRAETERAKTREKFYLIKTFLLLPLNSAKNSENTWMLDGVSAWDLQSLPSFSNRLKYWLAQTCMYNCLLQRHCKGLTSWSTQS